MEWYRNLWNVLSTKDKLPFLEQLIPTLPVPPAGQENPLDVVATHQAWVKAQKEIARLMLMTMDPYIQKNLEHLGAYDMLKELKTFLILVTLRKEYDGFVQNYNMHSMGKTVTKLHAILKLHKQTLPPREVAPCKGLQITPALHAIRAGRIQKNQKKKSHKDAKGNQGKGKAKIGNALVHAPSYAPKPKNPPTPKKDNPVKDAICHQCGEVGNDGIFLLLPTREQVFVARNAEFFENDVVDHEASRSLEDLEIIQEEDTHPSLDSSLNHKEDDQEIYEPQSDINPIRRSIRTRHAPDRMCLYIDAEEHELGDLGEPANYKAALLDPESEKWLNAMNVEMQSMKEKEVWELVDLLPDGKTIGHKWLFKRRPTWMELYIPIKSAFLNGYLNEEVYMKQPEGFVSQKFPNQACKLKRSIYGLKQASRQWNKRFDDEVKKFRFSQNHNEPCVYVKASGSYVTFLILYVDDILIMGNNISMLQDVKSYLGRCFAMKDLGEASYILGIKIYRDRSKRLIGLCDAHWTAINNIQKYLRNTKDMFLVYGGDTKRELKVSCYTDAGYLTDANDMKSQTEYVYVLNGGVVDWKSIKQSIFATLSTDAKYIAAFDVLK
nr:hypothetical protein [Tanacetum cinerariifolium]